MPLNGCSTLSIAKCKSKKENPQIGEITKNKKTLQQQQLHSQAKLIFKRRLHLFMPINLKSEKVPAERAACATNWGECRANAESSSWCIAVGVWLKPERSLTLSKVTKVTLGIKWAQVKRAAGKWTKCAHDGPFHEHTHAHTHRCTRTSARVDALNQNRCRKQVQTLKHRQHRFYCLIYLNLLKKKQNTTTTTSTVIAKNLHIFCRCCCCCAFWRYLRYEHDAITTRSIAIPNRWACVQYMCKCVCVCMCVYVLHGWLFYEHLA